jgi:hypothetical protein
MANLKPTSNRFLLIATSPWIFLPLVLLLLVFSATLIASAEEDPIYEKCQVRTDRPRPWCYQEEVEKIGDPDLCENILKYWPKADGVHGWCYYQLAMKNKDCSLCERIRTADIKKMCRKDVCN